MQVKAIFPSIGLEMVAQVYSNPNLGFLVVELTRRAGDAFKFNTIREDLAEKLGDLISGADDMKAIASKCVEGCIAFDSACLCDNHGLVKCLRPTRISYRKSDSETENWRSSGIISTSYVARDGKGGQEGCPSEEQQYFHF